MILDEYEHTHFSDETDGDRQQMIQEMEGINVHRNEMVNQHAEQFIFEDQNDTGKTWIIIPKIMNFFI